MYSLSIKTPAAPARRARIHRVGRFTPVTGVRARVGVFSFSLLSHFLPASLLSGRSNGRRAGR